MGRTAQIDIDHVSGDIYDVVVDEFTSARSFRVKLLEGVFERLSKGRSHEELIRDSFRFLLAREPKEQILEEFSLEDIAKYFPEFESTV